jgi:hypothetical protein
MTMAQLTIDDLTLIYNSTPNPLNPKTMRIIERTPIVLPNDNADTVEAVVYATKRKDRPYRVYISYPTIDRIIDEFDDESIIALWADQYPEWAKKIAPVI